MRGSVLLALVFYGVPMLIIGYGMWLAHCAVADLKAIRLLLEEQRQPRP